ncbi:SRPBCC family protein [Rubinisphaera margarita]|uniref:SRPBCC family protein n=1 Tax=Rubinisphaera margarita TaxID=2909586 RepID=UPI001EE78230|nr:SRPBCC family protein [Rubinisphaera margarita]MCG6155762.1 DUF2892 domain-containing protein [Rubinisphaera margarita]
MSMSMLTDKSITHPQQKSSSSSCCNTENVSRKEQWASLIGGGAVFLYGLRRGSWLGMLTGGSLLYRGWTGHCMVYDQLGINTKEGHFDRPGVRAQHGRRVNWTLHINRDPQELYDFWRELSNLPNVMSHLVSVQSIDKERSRWTARGPMGQTLEWEAEIITDKPGEVIAWQSLPGSQVDTAGSVHFRKSATGQGTDLEVTLKYDPPGGNMVAQIAHLVGQGLEDDLQEDLRRFKQICESGEIATNAQRPAMKA